MRIMSEQNNRMWVYEWVNTWRDIGRETWFWHRSYMLDYPY
jgi:hypothetical protein